MITSLLAPILALNILNYIPWTLLFLFTQPFGIRLYYIKEQDECIRIQNRIEACSHTTDGGKSYGYSIGYWYILYLTNTDGLYNVSMIASTSSYKALTEHREDEDKSLFEQGWKLPLQSEQARIKVYERSGSYTNVWYKKRERDAKDVARGQQKGVVDAIIRDYIQRRHTVAYIYGKPGTGKSMVGILVANEFASSFCNTLKLWQPGETLGSLLSDVDPTPQKPLVIVFDEFDLVLEKIHAGIPNHKNVPTMIKDKVSWNHTLDSIQRGMYPNIILILTSNRGPEYIESLDSSYIRKGRVDIMFEMTESVL